MIFGKTTDFEAMGRTETMEIASLTLGTRVRTAQDQLGTITGRRMNGVTDGFVDSATLPGEDAVTVSVDHIGVPPETIRVTVRPSTIVAIL
jgi:hypothetical protein